MSAPGDRTGMAYIARCKCGGLVMAIVDSPERRGDVAKETALAIRRGYTIERVTCEYVREEWTSCTCAIPSARPTTQQETFL